MKKVIKSIKVLFAIALAIILSVPANAFAAEEGEGTSSSSAITIKKTLTVEGDYAYFNGNTYTYTLSPVDATDKDYIEGKEPTDGLLVLSDEGKITFDPGDTSTEKTINVNVIDSKLQNLQPGRYAYEITESAKNNIDGETNDPLKNKTIIVTVYRDEAGKMQAVVEVDGQSGEAKSNLESSTTFKTNTLTVTKKLEGNNANLTDKFDFNVVIEGQENDKYMVDGKEQQEGTTETVTGIGNEDQFTIQGLTPEDIVKVTEKDSKGYEVTYNDETDEGLKGDQKEATITNTKTATVPTGLIETIAPFAIMILVALGLGLVYFRKRQEA